MSNQDIEGNVPGDAEPPAPVGTPEYFEQQLAKEREARAQMRERLRNTEALAAESHALRTRMAQELERVTAERDRLRSAVAAAPAAASATTGSPATATPAAGSLGGTTRAAAKAAPAPAPAVAPPMTPREVEWPLRPPAPPRRKGPWFALTMLGCLAVGIGFLAWITGSIPSELGLASAAWGPAPGAASTAVGAAVPASEATPHSVLAAATPPTASSTASPLPKGVVALPPLTPEAVLATAPAAAGNVPPASTASTVAISTIAPTAAAAGLSARLRSALDAEGVAAPVDIDAASGRVAVSDPAADNAQRERTDTIIRAVYAGASLPEPQIEHRWLSPPRAGRATTAALAQPEPAAAVAKTSVHSKAVHVAERDRHIDAVADTQPPERAIVPAGRFSASCRASAAGTSTAHRAGEMSACMKHSCCSAGNRQTEECRAYIKAYPSTCVAG